MKSQCHIYMMMELNAINYREISVLLIVMMVTSGLIESQPLTDMGQFRTYDELNGAVFGESSHGHHSNIGEYKTPSEGINTIVDGQRFHFYDYEAPTVDYDIYAQATFPSGYRESKPQLPEQQQQLTNDNHQQQQQQQQIPLNPPMSPAGSDQMPAPELGFIPPATHNDAESSMSYLLSIYPLMKDFIAHPPVTHGGYYHQPHYERIPHHARPGRPMKTTVGTRLSTTTMSPQQMERSTTATTTLTTNWKPVTSIRKKINIPKKKKVRPTVVLIKTIFPLSTTTYAKK